MVLETLHPQGLSVAAMPGIDILSVGGTVSVNAHGADFRTGSLAPSIRSLLLVTADGTSAGSAGTTTPSSSGPPSVATGSSA